MNIFLLGTVLLSLLSQVIAQDNEDCFPHHHYAQDNARLYQWNKTVPYFFYGKVTARDKVMIHTQMKLIENNTCVKFKEVTQQSAPSHRLVITVGGYYGGVFISNTEELHLNIACKLKDHAECENGSIRSGNVINKLMRVLGAIETHLRMDRDQYIQFNLDCVAYGSWFTKKDFILPSEGIPYKCNSIMHAHNGYPFCPTFKVQEGNDDCTVMGSDVPIPEDWKMLEKYQCGGK